MEYRDVKKYNWTGDVSLNKAILRFERYMAQKYKNKKYTVLLDSYLPFRADDNFSKSVYSVLFEFKNAKKPSNVERVVRS